MRVKKSETFGFCDLHAIWNHGKQCPVCSGKEFTYSLCTHAIEEVDPILTYGPTTTTLCTSSRELMQRSVDNACDRAIELAQDRGQPINNPLGLKIAYLLRDMGRLKDKRMRSHRIGGDKWIALARQKITELKKEMRDYPTGKEI